MDKAKRERACEGSPHWFFMRDTWTVEMAAALPQLSSYLQSDVKHFEMRSEIVGKENFSKIKISICHLGHRKKAAFILLFTVPHFLQNENHLSCDIMSKTPLNCALTK